MKEVCKIDVKYVGEFKSNYNYTLNVNINEQLNTNSIFLLIDKSGKTFQD